MKSILGVSLLLVRVVLVACISATCQPALCNQAESSEPYQAQKSLLPQPTGFVNDYAHVLDQTTKSRLESTLTELRNRSAIEFAVVFVETTGGQPINDYSLALARTWGIGPREPGKGGGLLLLVAVKDRRMRIEVSRSLEKDMPDSVVLELVLMMREPFRQNKYGEGVTKCVNAVIARLAERRGFTMGDAVTVEDKFRQSKDVGALTLAQVEKLIGIRTPDRTIAAEIRKRGVDFTVDARIVMELRRKGAGEETVRALLEKK